MRYNRFYAALVLTTVITCLTPPAFVRADEPATQQASTDDRLANAKRLFEEGTRLLDNGDLATALEQFQASRDFFPSIANTINVAASLHALGRHAEALSTYEQVLAQFGDRLEPDERRDIDELMHRLQSLVGRLEIAQGTVGELIVDGVSRGQLPLAADLLLDARVHSIRIECNGGPSFERAVNVPAGARVILEIPIAPPTRVKDKPSMPPVSVATKASRHKKTLAWRMDLVGGFLVGPTLSRDSTFRCVNCLPTIGGHGGARLGLHVHQNLTIELGGGLAGLESTSLQTTTSQFDGPSLTPSHATSGSVEGPFMAIHDLWQDVGVQSGFVMVGASVHKSIAGRLWFVGRASVGLIRSQVQATAQMVTRNDQGSIEIPLIQGSNYTDPVTGLILSPEVGLEMRYARFHFGIGVGATFMPFSTAAFGKRTFGVRSSAECHAAKSPAAPACALDVAVPTRAIFGSPVMASPGISVGYDF